MTSTEEKEEEHFLQFKKTRKPKQLSKLRTSFLDEDYNELDDQHKLNKPKKKLPTQLLRTTRGSRPVELTKDVPNVYSAEFLESLREATPVIPEKYVRETEIEDYTNETTSAGQKGEEVTSRQQNTFTGAEEEFIPLSDSLLLQSHSSFEKGKRHQTEDDIDEMGGLEDGDLRGFEDKPLPLGSLNQAKAQLQSRMDMDSQIQDWAKEHSTPAQTEDSSDSDDEWERTQVKKFSGNVAPDKGTMKTTGLTAPVLIPIPSMNEMLRNLDFKLQAARKTAAEKLSLIALLEAEQIEIAEREDAIREKLQKAGLEYETVRLKLGSRDILAGD